MRQQDLEQLESCLKRWKTSWAPSNMVICSANTEELEMVSRVFPRAWTTSLDVNQWNLDDQCPEESDMVLASNVFMCARDPKKWIDNARAKTKWLVVLDHCVAYRGGSEGEVSVLTGDVMRYTHPPQMVAKLPGAYDLRNEDSLKHLHAYDIPSGCGVEGYETTKMFVALFSGKII